MAAESSGPQFTPDLSASHGLGRASPGPVQPPAKRRSLMQDRGRARGAASDVVTRLAAFLATSSTAMEGGMARAHLLEEAAIALGAQRAAVIATAPNGTCLGWAGYGLKLPRPESCCCGSGQDRPPSRPVPRTH